jgi:hypothetical protein
MAFLISCSRFSGQLVSCSAIFVLILEPTKKQAKGILAPFSQAAWKAFVAASFSLYLP